MRPTSTSDEEPQPYIGLDTQPSPTPSLATEICLSESLHERQELDWEASESDSNTATDGTSSEGQTARNASTAVGYEREYQHNEALYHSHMDRFQPPTSPIYEPMEFPPSDQPCAPSDLPRVLNPLDLPLFRRVVYGPVLEPQDTMYQNQYDARPTSDRQLYLSQYPATLLPMNDDMNPLYQAANTNVAHTQGTPDTSMPESRPGNEVETRRKREKSKKKHQCERCGIYFLRPSSLEQHMTLHIGSRPHRCPRPRCPRHVQGGGFSAKSNMTRHLKSVKNEDPDD